MPLAPEFDRKLKEQAQQLNQQRNPQKGPKEHPEDILIVRNILVGDSSEVEEVIPYANARPTIDPTTGQPHFVNQIDTNLFEHTWNTKDFFEVRWDGRPHRIRPGEVRRMPRYLADHFAKYLIDFILIKREKDEDLVGLVKNRNERKKLYDKIIEGVDSYYNGDTWEYEREGTKVEQQVAELNTPDNSFNVGIVPEVAMGYALTDKPPEQAVHLDNIPSDPNVAKKPLNPEQIQEYVDSKSKNQLLAEAKALGIELKGTENKMAIYQAISNF